MPTPEPITPSAAVAAPAEPASVYRHAGFVSFLIARVVAVDRGRYTCVVDEDGPEPVTVLCVRAKELRRQPIVPGDLVGVVGDVTGGRRSGSVVAAYQMTSDVGAITGPLAVRATLKVMPR